MSANVFESNTDGLEYDEEFGMTEAEVDFRFVEAVRISKEIAKIKKKPTCEYDMKKRMPYLLYPDGHREYPADGERYEQ